MFEILSELKSLSFQLSSDVTELMKEQNTRTYIQNEFHQRDILVTWEIETSRSVMVIVYIFVKNQTENM